MNILDKIVEHKKKEVSEQEKDVLIGFYKKWIKELGLKKRDFAWNLKWKNTISLIAEIKKWSPSAGLIREEFDVKQITELYRRFASCISVLTDSEFFYWSFENLAIARENTDLPLLCKDFIISEYQIYKARYYWADAILLIAWILTTDQMQEFYDLTLELWMDAIFEVHDEKELEKVIWINWIKIIWINNRDLKTFEVDIQNTVSLVKKARQMIKKDLIYVSESWIKSASDLLDLKGFVDSALIWTSIIWSENPEEKIYELTCIAKIKICGITNIEDADMALYYWASYLWIILAPSKRRVDLGFAREIAWRASIVWVFVDEELEEIKKYLEYIDIIQLHWDEDDDFIEKLRQLTDKPIWKAVRIKTKEDLEDLPNSADKILFDTYSEKEKWWTWISFDWKYLNNLSHIRKEDIVLAWWINVSNVKEASKYADVLDVSSGVEERAGKKSGDKLEGLFRELRTAG